MTRRLSPEYRTAWGLVVVKPHAVAEGLVPAVDQILRRVSSEGVGVVFADCKSGHLLLGTEVSDPLSIEVGPLDEYFELSYYRAREKPFYPTLIDEYSGVVTVFSVVSDTVPQQLFDDALDDLKGAVGIRSGSCYLRNPTGIRGALMAEVDDTPVTRDSLVEAEIAMLRNVVHTTNSSEHNLPQLNDWLSGVNNRWVA